MNSKTLSFIGLSAVFALGAMFVAKNWLDKNQQELTEKQAKVAVAIVNISVGTLVEAKHINFKVLPVSALPEGTIETPEEVIGKVAKDAIYAKDIVRKERLVNKGEGSTLASLIGENKRAVTIRVNDIIGVAGFLLPGNHVDILNTINEKGRIDTEVILSNIKILAIDQKAAKSENNPQLVRAVTIEVDIEQAEILMNARSVGSLQLALRNPSDRQEAIIAKQEVIQKVTPQQPLPKVKPIDVVPVKQRLKVQVIRGVAQESIQVEI